MQQATHAQLERLTMTDDSVAFNVLLWDEDEGKDHGLRMDCADERSARDLLALLEEQRLIEVLAEVAEASH
jgi:hypothetical protein